MPLTVNQFHNARALTRPDRVRIRGGRYLFRLDVVRLYRAITLDSLNVPGYGRFKIAKAGFAYENEVDAHWLRNISGG
jgi:hypothetical protein